MAKKEPGPVRPCMDPGVWSNPETNTIYNLLEWENDHLLDILDRMNRLRKTEEFTAEEELEQLAFIIEDDLRADIRYHYIEGSMWEGLVMGFIERTDFKEIAAFYLGKRSKEKAFEK